MSFLEIGNPNGLIVPMREAVEKIFVALWKAIETIIIEVAKFFSQELAQYLIDNSPEGIFLIIFIALVGVAFLLLLSKHLYFHSSKSKWSTPTGRLLKEKVSNGVKRFRQPDSRRP